LQFSKTPLWRRLRRFGRELRHTPDRLLHASRRRRSTAALPIDPPAQVLFVCHGNICRSPYAAESLLRLGVHPLTKVLSAGFVGPGRSVPAYGQKVAQRRGVDLAAHRSQLLTAELVRMSDLIVVMDRSQQLAIAQRFGRAEAVLVLGDLDPSPIDMRTVRDPYNQPEDVFEAVYARIDRCLAELTPHINRSAAVGTTSGARPGSV
jgi:protein-tyrosine-phosphatase